MMSWQVKMVGKGRNIHTTQGGRGGYWNYPCVTTTLEYIHPATGKQSLVLVLVLAYSTIWQCAQLRQAVTTHCGCRMRPEFEEWSPQAVFPSNVTPCAHLARIRLLQPDLSSHHLRPLCSVSSSHVSSVSFYRASQATGTPGPRHVAAARYVPQRCWDACLARSTLSRPRQAWRGTPSMLAALCLHLSTLDFCLHLCRSMRYSRDVAAISCSTSTGLIGSFSRRALCRFP
jgi:hypothetical protein